ncbi:MAG: type II toxin-antitoxin system RelE/ParE family toxin [Thaumarchaeota archaeon]|nr:type II toxin-antitoxin system RelE/ParE family toxin [Nitrososphaerota archaeon]
MSFRVFLHPKAAKYLQKLQESHRERILAGLRELETTPEKGDQLKPSRFWRLRIGDYRAIYEIDKVKGTVVVLYIGHRRNVYDDFSRLI